MRKNSKFETTPVRIVRATERRFLPRQNCRGVVNRATVAILSRIVWPSKKRFRLFHRANRYYLFSLSLSFFFGGEIEKKKHVIDGIHLISRGTEVFRGMDLLE